MRGYYKLFALTMVLFALNTAIYSQKVMYSESWGKQGFSLLETDASKVQINYSLTEFYLEDLKVDGLQVKSVKVPGIFLPNNEGAPDLAGTGQYVAIPQGAKISYKIIASRTEKIENVDIAPAPRIPLDTDTGPLHYEKNTKIYSKNAFYPSKNVQLKTSKIRGVDVVMIGITPFQYNPVTKELIVYRDLKVELNISGGTGHIGDDRLRSRWWDPIIYDAVLNPNVIPEIDYATKSKSSKSPDYEYLIIVPDDPVFISWADSIKNWRTLQGIKTGVVTTTEIGGNTTTAIESYVNDAYLNWDIPPSAVLLIGDHGTSGSTIVSPIYDSYCVSDNIYADVDSDHLPDIVFARMTAQNETHLETMITKFLDYEQNPPTDAYFYNHPITALGWQTERWFQICSETVGGFWKNVQGKDPIRINEIYSGTPGSSWSTATNTSTVIDYFGPNGLGYLPATPDVLGDWSGGSATMINNALNSGAFMLQHRDHGGETGWGEPAYYSSDIDGLTNTNLSWIFSINCLTGKYDISGECFAEKFHRYKYNGQNSGALGITAASEVSYSFVNDTYVWGLMDNMWTDFMPDYGTDPPSRDILPAFGNAAGKIFLAASSWPYNTSNKEVTYHLFHHHGDAFTTVYSEIPQYLSVTNAAALLSGTNSFTVTADAGSFIALTVNGEIIGTADGTGSPAVISILPQNPGDILIVTVTKQNYYRYSSNVAIIPPSGPYVAYNNHAINDALGNNNGQIDFGEDISLHITVENLGSAPAYNVNATLVCSDPNLTLTDNSESFGTISNGATPTISDAFSFSVTDDIPDQHIFDFELHISDNSEETWISYFSVTANAPNLDFGNISIDDNAGGNGNGRLDPGESADITVPVLNNGNSDSPSASTLITSTSGYITVNSATATLGVISATGNTDAIFNISCDPLTPVGTSVDLTVDVTADNYGINNTFYKSVGLVLEDWETGNFDSYPWTLAGDIDWLITDVDPYEETWCAQSGITTDSQTSELEVELNVTIADNISFFRKVSSESGYDYLSFYIDGSQQEQWTGEVAWGQVSYPVTAGVHTFKWVYSKDGSVSSGSDCSWVDFIIFPSISPLPDPADIEISAVNFDVTLSPDDLTSQLLLISNVGEDDLDFTIAKNYQSTKNAKAYCTSVGGGTDEFIQNVTIGSINNTTIQSNYADYTSLSTIVNAGESYPITITNGDPNWSTDQCGIWVDWNQNEDFLDDVPIVITGTPGVGPYTATITPPVDALPGLARMRVQIIYSATPEPCLASFSYGEIEDYSLNVNSDFVDWLTFDTVAGSVLGGTTSEIELTFNSNNLDEGDYFVDVILNSNDPDESQLTIPCTLHVSSGININLTALLEGPFVATEMNTPLNDLGYLPNTQPYNVPPWNYPGTETVVYIPNSNVVDWILVELRETTGDASTATPATVIAQKAGFILKDGSIVDTDGISLLRFDVNVTNNLYTVIYHRNHLGIMSANPLTIFDNTYVYDFTTAMGQVYGNLNGHSELLPGIYGMASGDADSDGEVDNRDKNEIWKTQMGNTGYFNGDFDMNGSVDLNDKMNKWKFNSGNCSFIVK